MQSAVLDPTEIDIELTFQPAHLIELLRQRAHYQPDQLAYTFLLDGESKELRLTYHELDLRARAIGAWLQSAGATGEQVLLLYPPDMEYVSAFFGCLYAGAVAVPAYPPRLNRTLSRLQAIVADAQPSFVLTTSQISSRVESLLEHTGLKRMRWLATDHLDNDLAAQWREPAVNAETLAFLQYTSGSTATPKGVMVSHGNLLQNEAIIRQAFAQTSESVIVGWLPLYHDMGLIGNVLQPLYVGAHSVLMSPVAFLQSPFRWLKAISHYRATTSGGPNFAYDLCVRKITEEQKADLDLSSWQLAFNGAEPIRAETLDRFATAFASCGFRREAFFPCYGLAEATLFVAGKTQSNAPAVIKQFETAALSNNRVVEVTEESQDASSLVGCGGPGMDQTILIVNPETARVCPPGEVGEIWVSGASVAGGYWNQPEATEATFRAFLAESSVGPFLCTGDLGFLNAGELFVTGRLKDLIIIRGRNLYPQDIERTVEQSHKALRPGAGAAFAVDAGGEEHLVIVQEVERHYGASSDEIMALIRRRVAEDHEVQTFAVVLVKTGTIPKTSSGKIQRHACRASFLQLSLDVVGQWQETDAAELDLQAKLENQSDEETRADTDTLESWLQAQLAAKLHVHASIVDINQPLTHYGLDSLMAIELMHEIEAGLGVNLPVASLLESASITQLALQIRETRTDAYPVAPSKAMLAAADEATVAHPLSSGQKSLWFLYQLAPESAAYNLAFAARIKSDLDTDSLKSAFQALVDRHASLRTTFGAIDGEPVQRVQPLANVCFNEHDGTDWNEATLNQRLVREAHRPFDLEHGPLLRIHLFHRAAKEHILLLVAHHIVVDFWSLAILMYELGALYAADKSGLSADLAPLALQYTDYVRWQSEILASVEGDRHWAYWQRQLADPPRALDLPTDHPRPSLQTYRGASQFFKIDAELVQQLKTLSQRHGATLYMTLLAAFQVLLHRYTGQEDILVGSPTAGRSRPELAGQVGYFVNPVVLRADFSERQTFETYLNQVRRNVLSAFEHQEFPFSLLVQRLQPEREASRSPLFQAMFTLQKSHLLNEAGLTSFALGEPGSQLKLGDLLLESMSLEQRIAQFDITLMMAEVEDGFGAALEYNTDLFEEETIGRMVQHFLRLVTSIVSDPGVAISELQLLTGAEEQQLEEWNDTAVATPREGCVHDLFEAQAARTPMAVALIDEEQTLSYGEVERRANQLAHHLRSLGVGPEDRVGVLLERSVEMVVALLGVLKAGGAYVPLDGQYPAERLQYMVEDSGLKVLITEAGLGKRVRVGAAAVVDVGQDAELIAGQSEAAVGSGVTGANLAYVIYTSGSTGRPKGVAIQHASTTTLIHWAQQCFTSAQLAGVLASTSICFDLSVFELFVPLSGGGKVILAENALQLPALAAAAKVTLVNTVPSAMAELLRLDGVPASVQVVNLAGEPLSAALAGRVYQQETIAALYNLYGPTEDTTYSTGVLVGREAQAPTIGRPLANTEVYILDRQMALVPVGVTGELYLTGEGLARGYLQRPGLTAERFIPHPLSRRPGARLYQTGDLARYRVDGEIEFLGREDDQVKVRGYRIELGEVEAVLGRHAGVGQAVVMAREERGGEKRLVGYVVAAAGEAAPGVSELRRHLEEQLPEYMIPTAFVYLEQLPLTSNGKVDRRGLPEVERGRPELEQGYVAGRTPVEEVLCGIWGEVLGVEQVGIHDNFFELGGHSLLATQLISRVRQMFRVEVALRELFERPTLGALAEKVEAALRAAQGVALPALQAGERGVRVPLSFAQQRLWFLDQLEPHSPFYNMPAAVRLSGRLDKRALEATFNQIIGRHEILRTIFAVEDGHAVQVVQPASSFSLPVVELSALIEDEREAAVLRLAADEAQMPFDLASGPLLRVSLVKLGESEHVMLLTMHHIISDGWSTNILVQEVAALYQAYSQQQPARLPDLTLQYGDFACWQREWLTDDVLRIQLDYWKQQLSGAPPALELPTDRPRPAVQSFTGSSHTFTLSKVVMQSLKALGQQEGATLFMTLLAAFKVLLWRYTSQDEIVVGTPIAGRTQLETERLIGFFVNTLVLRTDLSRQPGFRELLRRVREVCLGAYAHQDVPFEQLVEVLPVQRDLSRTPLFQVMFALGNAPLDEFEFADLRLSLLETPSVTAKFDLSLSVVEVADGLRGTLEYNTDLFEEETIGRMVQHFLRLVTSIVSDPGVAISELQLLTGAEEQQLEEWNDTAVATPREGCVHDLFEAQAARTPMAVALIDEEQTLSYGEVERRANQLAHHLRSLGVGPEDRVGVLLERSVEMVVALLGVLKAGGAYVPLDGQYPAERLQYMVEDSGLKVLITEAGLGKRVRVGAAAVVDVGQDAELIAGQSEAAVASGVTGANLAYVIYTSGSTGRPKGVAIQHASTTTLIHWAQQCFTSAQLAGVLASTSICFDLSVFELFVPLSGGGKVILAENALQLPALAAAAKVTLVNTVPSAMAELLRLDGVPASVQVVNLAGEPLSAALAERVYQQETIAALYNLYGPTEDTTYSTGVLVGREAQAPTIGRPLANTEVYILDRQMALVPVGVTGELYLTGEGLARGYLQRPGLTAERFIPHPLSRRPGARLYQTGDLARYRVDGEIEFLGREDDQVKVRGYRIELGEVEAVLGRHAGVGQAVVMAREERGGEKRLVGYVVAAAGEAAPGVSELRRHLEEQLPEYMIPTAFVYLEQLPLTSNGKVDRRALPEVERGRPELEQGYVAGRTPVEEVLCGIWGEVLGVEQVGIHDNFFELGGHSLLATQLISRVRQMFRVEVALRELFERPTLGALAEKVEAALRAAQGVALPALQPGERGVRVPLSFAQQRLWFLDQLEPHSPFYNMPAAVRLSGRLDKRALEATFNQIIGRHEILRTTFPAVSGEPVQVIAEAEPLRLAVTDLSGLGEAERERESRRLMAEEAQRPFDLSAGPLLRVGLLGLGAEEHILLFTMHHIISDGWSSGLLVQEVAALYEAMSGERPSPLAPLTLQYGDFALWQRQWLTDEVLRTQLDYWQQQLSGAPPALELPTDRARPAVQSFRGATHSFTLSAAQTEQLQALSRREGVTLFMTLLAGFQLLLARYSGQTEIVVGTPIAGRTQVETEGLIGLFVNTLVLRTELSGNPTFVELLHRVREVCLGAYAHQDVPFERLVDELQPARSLAHTPLFQVMFALHREVLDGFEFSGLSLNLLETQSVTSKFDLSLSVVEAADGLRGTLEYNTDLFEGQTIARLAQHFLTLIASVATNSARTISELNMLTVAEEQQLLSEWNDTDVAYPIDRCLHHLIEAQVQRTPHGIAVTHHEQTLSYSELNAKANQLAHHLRSLGVGLEDRVGVLLERSVEMVVALLGVLKAGGAYVPLDGQYPAERLQYMMEDSGLKVLITESGLAERVRVGAVAVVDVEQDAELIAGQSEAAVASGVEAENLAYVIYTSGSTGRPKGVQISHQAVVNFLHAMREQPGITAQDVVLAITTLSFDIAVLEIYLPLIVGARVVVVDREVSSNGELLSQLISESDATLMQATPVTWQLLLEARWKGDPRLKILYGGQAMPREFLGKLLELGFSPWNLYGPTETTVWVTASLVQGMEGASIIGRPISNIQIYILDKHLHPVPVGVTGELYLTGEGLARGYLQRPGLTAERFIPHPLSRRPGARLYQTGDLARYRVDGEIEFLGREDDQVKVRGYRIELGEVEAVLGRHAGVGQAVVMAREERGGEKRLVGYVVAAAGEAAPGVSELRRHLEEQLPEYMIPTAFVYLEQLPLTSNGKVDRRALPEVERGRPELEQGYVAGRTPVEEVLCGIWGEVLGVEQVGIHDNFFELGGHSLLATQLISRVRQMFRVEVALRELFERPTLGALAEKVEAALRAAQGVALPALQPGERGVRVPLSFAQQRLWFLDQLEPHSPFYNMPAAVRLSGRLDKRALEATFNQIIGRHEILRTTFPAVSGEPVQVIAEAEPLRLAVTDLSGLGEAERERESRRLMAEEAQRPFDLSAGPLLRVGLLGLGAEEHILLFTMHHIISDGWSSGLLVQEVAALYEAMSGERPSPLAPLTLQYGDFALWQRQWLTDEVLRTQLDYWQQQLSGAPPALELPTDRARPAVQSFRGATHSFTLSAAQTEQLQALSRREGVTLFMTLLAGFQLLLARYSGQTEIVVGTPIAGRTQVETEGLIGLFVNTLVLRTELSGNPTFVELLHRVREVCLGAYAHQDVPFERLVDELQPARSLAHTPLFQVMFAVEHEARRAVALTGLRLEPLAVARTTTHFDLGLSLNESGEGLQAVIEYNLELFERETIERLGAHYQMLLAAAVAEPEQAVWRLGLVTDGELQQLEEWEEGRAGRESEELAHEMFERQAAERPEAMAVRSGNREMSYRELNERANQIGHYLQEQGVGGEQRVGVLMERSVEQVAAVLGIMKVGGVYVPLDPGQPGERLRYMMEDAGVGLVLTRREWQEVVEESGVRRVNVDEEEMLGESRENPGVESGGESLAYLIYTSGSSGQPKAVAVEQGQMAQTLRASREEFEVGATDRLLSLSSISFDISLWEMMLPLVSGAGVELVSREEVVDVGRLAERVREVTLLHAVPTLMQPLVRYLEGQGGVTNLRQVFVGGEAVSGELLREMEGVFGEAQLQVLYGPTEATMICTSYKAGRGVRTEKQMIGKGLAGVRLSIRDTEQQRAPVGVSGELWIGGGGVSRGYLNQEELTAVKYVQEGEERWYRSGDRARWLGDGNLEFLGREDDQVKVRGYRIELGEVEAVLGRHAGVGQAVVMAREERGGEKRLVGYVVAAAGEAAPGVSELRRHLEEQLPEYMIPTAFVYLEQLPLTSNGKVDRRALPEVERGRPELEQGYVAGRTPVEEVLCGIWGEVLGVEQVGIHDNFFELGGDSILSIQIVARAAQAGVQLTPRQLFQHQSVAALATVANTTAAEVEAEQGLVSGRVPLTPIEERFFGQQLREPEHYNQGLLLEVVEGVNGEWLEQAVQELLVQHDGLRMRFEPGASGWQQQNLEQESEQVFRVCELGGETSAGQGRAIEREAERAQRSLSLRNGPLLRVVYFGMGAGQRGRLLLVIHHLVVDGVSWRILLADLERGYQQLAGGETVELGSKTSSFKQWAERLQAYAESAELAEQVPYWQAQGAAGVAGLVIECSAAELAVCNTVGSSEQVQVSLSEEQTRALLTEVGMAYHAQIQEVLLAGVALGYARWSGESRLRVDVEGHGREQEVVGEVDVSRTVGWFTTVYPVLLEVGAGADAVAAVKQVKEQVRRVPGAGLGYGVLRWLSGDEEVGAALAGGQAAQVSFNYLGQLDQVLTGSGLLVGVAQESSGPDRAAGEQREYVLEVGGSVVGGRLHLHAAYSPRVLQRERVHDLMLQVKLVLTQIIDQRTNPLSAFFTPSDFPLANLDEQKLSKLSKLLTNLDEVEAVST